MHRNTESSSSDEDFSLEEEVKSYTRALLRQRQQQHNHILPSQEVKQISLQIQRKYENRYPQSVSAIPIYIQEVAREFNSDYSPEQSHHHHSNTTNVISPTILHGYRPSQVPHQPLQSPRMPRPFQKQPPDVVDQQHSHISNIDSPISRHKDKPVRRLHDHKESTVTASVSATTSQSSHSISGVNHPVVLSRSVPPLKLPLNPTYAGSTPRVELTETVYPVVHKIPQQVQLPQRQVSYLPIHRVTQPHQQQQQVQPQQLLQTSQMQTTQLQSEKSDKLEKLLQQKDDELKDLKHQLEKHKDENSTLRHQISGLEKQMKEMQHSMDLWKLEYHKNTSTKFKQLMGEVELQSKREMETSVRKQLEEEERKFGLELQKRNDEISKYKLLEEELHFKRLQEQEKRHGEDKGKRRMAKLRDRLYDLWEALDTHPEEQIQFFKKVQAAHKYSDDVAKVYKHEIIRYSDQLPLMENIMKREFIKQRLREFRMNSITNNILDRKEELQKSEIEKELKRLEESLFTELPQYEKKYNSPFKYNGKQYMSQLMSENSPYNSPLKFIEQL
jgi:hypothetical protein